MPETEKKYAPSAWIWVGGFLVAVALLAALVAFYFYRHSPH
jgi:hypothetical protein